jgi:hypothetical protein
MGDGPVLRQNPLLRLIGSLIPQRLVDNRDDVLALRVQRASEVHPLGGTHTQTRNHFANALIYDSQGRHIDARRELYSMRELEEQRSLGKNKFIYEVPAEAQHDLGIFRPVIIYFDLTLAQQAAYVAALGAFAADSSFNSQEIKTTTIPSVIIAYYTDEVPGHEFLREHEDPAQPVFLDVIVEHCIRAAVHLNKSLQPVATEFYELQEKLIASLQNDAVQLSIGGQRALAALIEAYRDEAIKDHAVHVDRAVENVFVNLMYRDDEEIEEILRQNMRLAVHASKYKHPNDLEELNNLCRYPDTLTALAALRKNLGSIQRRLTPHDFETCCRYTAAGVNVADMVMKTPVALNETHVVAARKAFGLRELTAGEIARYIRLASIYEKTYSGRWMIAGHNFEQFTGVTLTDYSAAGITEALNTQPQRIIARVLLSRTQ